MAIYDFNQDNNQMSDMDRLFMNSVPISQSLTQNPLERMDYDNVNEPVQTSSVPIEIQEEVIKRKQMPPTLSKEDEVRALLEDKYNKEMQKINAGRALSNFYSQMGGFQPDLGAWDIKAQQAGAELSAYDKMLANKAKEKETDSTKMKEVRELRKDFESSKVVENTRAIDNQVTKMASAWEAYVKGGKKSANALDQALITIFNKINDPGSVVRESEYNRYAENLSAQNKLKGTAGKWILGGAGLTDDERMEMIRMSNAIAKEQRESKGGFNDIVSQYEEEASILGVPIERIIRGDTKDTKYPDIYIKKASDEVVVWDDKGNYKIYKKNYLPEVKKAANRMGIKIRIEE